MDRQEKAYNAAMALAENELKKKYSKEESLQMFISAGILDKDGNFTEPYQNLAKYVKYTNR